MIDLAPTTAATASSWRFAHAASAVMVFVAVVAVAARVTIGERANVVLRLDTLSVVMLSLVAFVGLIVIRFSANYVAGDAQEPRYVRRLLATLAAVFLVVVANNLIVLAVAWAGASVALHGLLTFFGDRPVARAVAHKKFLLARCADVCMAGAAVSLWVAFRTLRLDSIALQAGSSPDLSVAARVGVFLVACAAIMKCAQLPFHGWLIQVMEAPTPVSALLHAGVVNLGGFVLLRFAPLVDRSVETRSLIVVAGVSTALVASLVMTTRVSIKVALAWSTCAQMGFMLVQCGLGLWEMALVHLVAHSLYKAHAFLGAGGTVRQTQRRQLVTAPSPPDATALLRAVLLAMAGTAAVGLAWQSMPKTATVSAEVWVMLVVVALAIVPLTTPRRGSARGGRALQAFAVPVVYLALHELASHLVPAGADAAPALLALTAVSFVALFVVQSLCLSAPEHPLVRRIRPWLYAGLFLDDVVTRLAFAVWPPPAATVRPAALPMPRCTIRPIPETPLAQPSQIGSNHHADGFSHQRL